MDLGLRDRGALVVGASGDIGGATARGLAAEGVGVVAAGRDRERLAALRDVCVASVELDLADEATVRSAVAEAEDVLGGIDILVCAAMGSTYGSVWTMDRLAWEEALRVKYVGTADVCRRVAERMVVRRAGVVVNLVGVAAELLFPANPVGGDVNLALSRFTRFLAAEVAPAGVRVLGVSPGYVRGRRLGAFVAAGAGELEETVPLGRIALPEEVADLVTFLVSPRAGYVTGTIVTIDGGLSLPAPVRRTPVALQEEAV